MKKVLKIIRVIVIIMGLLVAVGMFFITRGLKVGAEMVIQDINPAVLENGSYQGSYKGERWLSEVNVTIKDQQITQIELLSEPMLHPGRPDFSQDLFNRVITEQNTNVDVISGATVTSKVYLKSIENALTK